MTKEQIFKLIIENGLVEEVYADLHLIIMVKLGNLRDRVDEANAELRLIKKFAAVNKLDVIKDILSEEVEENGVIRRF